MVHPSHESLSANRGPRIGSKHLPHRFERRNPSTGEYQALRPPLSDGEIELQRALTHKPSPGVLTEWLYTIVIIAIVMAIYFWRPLHE